MPTYEYECTKCHHTFEEFKPMTAPRRQRCPACRGKVERLISGGTGIVFKGAGFYVNDSRRQSGVRGKTKTDSKSDAHPKSGGDDAAKTPANRSAQDKPSQPAQPGSGQKPGAGPAV